MKVKANRKTYEVFRVSEMQSKEQLIAFMGHPDLVHTKIHGIGFGAEVSYSVYIEDLDDYLMINSGTILLKDNYGKIIWMNKYVFKELFKEEK